MRRSGIARVVAVVVSLVLLQEMPGFAADVARTRPRVVVSPRVSVTSKIGLTDAGADVFVVALASVLARPADLARTVRGAAGLLLPWPPTARGLATLERLDVSRCRLLVDVATPAASDRALAARLGPCAVTWMVAAPDAEWLARVPAANARVRWLLDRAPDETTLAPFARKRLTVLARPEDLASLRTLRDRLGADWLLGAALKADADEADLRALESFGEGLSAIVVDGEAPALPDRWLALPGDREWRLPPEPTAVLLDRVRRAVTEAARPGRLAPTDRELDAPLQKLPTP